jgi:uncharacterized membrane protein YphA (DoxX/SURF4 family)
MNTSAPSRISPGALRWAPWISTALRVALGAVWVVAGASKAADLGESVRAVRAYQLLPEWAVPAVGAGPSGTPTVLVDGQRVENLSVDALKAAVAKNAPQ